MPLRKVAKKQSPYDVTVVNDASFVIGAETSNAITVNVQLKDSADKDLAQRAFLAWYLAGDVAGDTLASAITSVAAGTDGVVRSNTAGLQGWSVSESDGDIDFVCTLSSGAATVYLVIVLPDGRLKVSSAITFAA